MVDERLDVDVKALGWRHDPSRIFTKIVKGDGDGTQSTAVWLMSEKKPFDRGFHLF